MASFVYLGAAMSTPRANGHRYRQARKAVLEASDICWICGHPGAGEADHVEALSINPVRDVADPGNLAPAHGVHSPCPVCPLVNGKPRRCNQSRGNGSRTSKHVRRSIDW